MTKQMRQNSIARRLHPFLGWELNIFCTAIPELIMSSIKYLLNLSTITGIFLFILVSPTTQLQAKKFQFKQHYKLKIKNPTGMALEGNFLWVSDMYERKLVKIELNSGKILKKIEAPGSYPTGLAFADSILYHTDRRLDKIYKFQPHHKLNRGTIPYFERWARGMDFHEKHLYLIDSRSSKLLKIDPDDGTTISSHQTPASHPTGLAFGMGYLWTADHHTDLIYKLDPENFEVIAVFKAPGTYTSALAVKDKTLYLIDYADQTLYSLDLSSQPAYIEDKPRKVQVSYEVIYRKKGKGTIKSLQARLSIPSEMPGQHLDSKITFTPKPVKIEEDTLGQKLAVFELGDLADEQPATIKWTGKFSLYRVSFQLEPAKYNSVYPPANFQQYLQNGKKYDLESEYIKKLVKKIIGSETNYYWKARKIYDYLTQNIVYKRTGGWNNAAAVLKRGTGSCSEYTFALIALLRSANIPARYVGAVSERGDKTGFDDVFHRWAEIWFPEAGWIPVDANAGFGEAPGKKGFHFGGRSNRHVITTVSAGKSKYLDWNYNHNQKYKTEGNATLDVQAVARYQSLETKNTKLNTQYLAFSTPCSLAPKPKSKSESTQSNSVSPENKQAKNTDITDNNKVSMGIFLLFGFFLLCLGLFMGYMFRAKYTETKSRNSDL
jgi:transglutaminase-like putative cysteine protease